MSIRNDSGHELAKAERDARDAEELGQPTFPALGELPVRGTDTFRSVDSGRYASRLADAIPYALTPKAHDVLDATLQMRPPAVPDVERTGFRMGLVIGLAVGVALVPAIELVAGWL